jgi:hypothetical protein
MKLRFGGFLLLLLLLQTSVYSQFLDNIVEDESMLYAHTKQVNQFFRRFNGEENQYGERFSTKDSLYRSPKYRKRFIEMLFDKENPNINPRLKTEFIFNCTRLNHEKFLDFHGGSYFAEVKTSFVYKGEQKDCVLFLKLQEEEIGSKWVITNVVFEPFLKQFINAEKLPETDRKFLHPLSHELDFMNLIKVFTSKAVIEQFAEKDYKPDFLTLFIYEFKNSNLQFTTVKDVKFHFFQLDGWYFELSKFNRKSNNSGWLVSNLLKITDTDRTMLKSLIFREDQ